MPRSVSIFSLLVQRTGETLPFLLLVQEKGGKRTTQGRGRFRFLPNALLRKLFALRCPVLIRKPARETIPFLLLVQEKGGKRTTQEGEDFDFFPLLTPLIETMKEGDTPSFKSPLRCAKREAFFLRTSFPAGDRGLPLPGAEEGRTQSLQPQPLFPVEARDVEGAVSCPGNAAVALPQGGGKAKIFCCLRGGKRDILIYNIM